MKLDKWEAPFYQIKWLLCEGLSFDGDRYLTIQLVEHHVVDRPYKAKNESALEKLIEKSKPIERTEKSQTWTVVFDDVVAFRSSSESFYFELFKLARPEEGARAFFLRPSPWIEKIESDGVLDLVHPNCKHFVIFTDHCTIEVISADDPRIDS